MKAAGEILPPEAGSRLADYKRAVTDAVPGVEKLILFGSRARGDARDDSDYDIAVIVRELSDRRHISRILSDLAYDHILAGFFIRPIAVPLASFARATGLADEIARDGIEVL